MRLPFSSAVLTIFVALFAGTAVCQTSPRSPQGYLAGDVADVATNAPIAKAFILVHQPEGKKDFIVKVSNGKFELSLAPGFYDVFVSAAGFAPTCKRIAIVPGRSNRYNPRLQAQSEQSKSN